MAALDTPYCRYPIGKTRSCLLLSFLISSIILVLLTCRNYGIGVAKPLLFEFTRKSASSSRDSTVKLHPEYHTRRAATTIAHHWNITKGYRSPDGVHKQVYLIDGKTTSSIAIQFFLLTCFTRSISRTYN